MASPSTIQMRMGILTLVISRLIFTTGYALAGPFVQAMGSPDEFARVAGSAGFRTGMFINTKGIMLEFFGFLGLYAYLNHSGQGRLAFIAWLVATLGVALTLPPTGVLPFVFPHIASLYTQSSTVVFEVATAIFDDPLFMAVLGPAGLLVTLGAFLFSAAIWRQGRTSRVAAVLFALANLFLSFAPAIPVPALVWPVDLAGAVLLTVSGTWIAAGVWRYGPLANIRDAEAAHSA
jgi:hypothetical protein